MTELEELKIVLRAIEDAMYRTHFGAEWDKLRDIAVKLNTKIKAHATRFNSDLPK